MLKQRLDEVNAILAKLIALTEEDIENIKVAKHESVTPSVEEKKQNLSRNLLQLKNNLMLPWLS